MKEYNVERAWRDARLNRIGAGTDEIMLEVILVAPTGCSPIYIPIISAHDQLRS